MQAKKLIEILSKIPPNTEVVLWNGHVEDYMPIKEAVVESLYKLRPEVWAELANLQAELFDGPFEKIDPHTAKNHPLYKKVEWGIDCGDLPNSNYYARKVLMLEPGTRGKTSYSHRGENVHY